MFFPLYAPVTGPDKVQTSIVATPPAGSNAFYGGNRAPLKPTPLVKLPITAFEPKGWLRRSLELQRDGLTGNLGELSVWLTKADNAWLSPTGKGKYGWEEVPYWLRGYSRVAYALRDPSMLAESKFWIEGTLNSARPNGDFGPIHDHRPGVRDLWAQMLMLQVLQSWYEFSGDPRVIPFMTNYFHWQLTIPDKDFLKDYWENSRGGDNLASVYWVYNRTGDPKLLELATKIDRNSANWRQTGDLPNYHNVNVAQCFREPAIFWQQSGKPSDLQASYDDFDFIREKYGQVPGGMFGSDENARPGHDDPHQAVETCGMVEQIYSNNFMLAITGDPKWVANTEDVAFNTLPAAFTADYKALRYLTAPNMAISDAANHEPGIANGGPFMLMNPFSSRCCQHNHTSAWVNFLEGTWMATSDQGLAALTLSDGTVRAKVAGGSEVSIATATSYPFEETATMTVSASKPTAFPLYVLIPEWTRGATVAVGGQTVKGTPGRYVRVEKTWNPGEKITVRTPMAPRVKIWDQMRNAASVEYGPLTFSLKIGEALNPIDGRKSVQGDSGWQPGADPTKWPTYEIRPTSPWNFGLLARPSFRVIKRPLSPVGNPFTLGNVPIEIVTQGKRIPTWTFDENGLVAILPKSPVRTETAIEAISLVPMGAARLRISAFPVVR